MKISTLVTLSIFLSLPAFSTSIVTEPENSIKTYDRDLSDDLQEQEKTPQEVIQELKCMKDSAFKPIFEALEDKGLQYLKELFAKGVPENKRYFSAVGSDHNVMYFKIGHTIFIHFNRVNEDGTLELLQKGFYGDRSLGCIKVLPESCVWKGNRQVKYVELCESGLDVSHELRNDLFRVSISETEGVVDPQVIVQAIKKCYKPNCYSIAYECFQKGLSFDVKKAVLFMKTKVAQLKEQGYNAYIDYFHMAVKYTKVENRINEPTP